MTVTPVQLLSLMPEVLKYKQPVTKKGWWVSVPGARRVGALNKHPLYMYILRSIFKLASYL